MTIISVIKVMGLRNEQRQIAEVFAFDALVFLMSAVASYFSMRYEPEERSAIDMERIADMAFLIGLAVMTLAGFLLTYEII